MQKYNQWLVNITCAWLVRLFGTTPNEEGFKERPYVCMHTYVRIYIGWNTCIPADPNFDISSLDYDVTTISSALKAFFKLLPSPLFPDDSTQAVLSIFGTYTYTCIHIHTAHTYMYTCLCTSVCCVHLCVHMFVCSCTLPSFPSSFLLSLCLFRLWGQR